MAKLTFRVDSTQWEDTFWYDKKIDAMAPAINIGDVIQLQINALSYEIVEWKQFMSEHKKNHNIEKSFSQSGPDKSLYSIHGIVKIIYKYKRKKENMLERKPNIEIWEAIIDCGIPVIVVCYSQDVWRISTQINEGGVVECTMPLWGDISFYKGKFSSPIAGKVLGIDEKISYIPGWVKEEKKYIGIEKSYYKLITIDTSITEPIKYKIDYI